MPQCPFHADHENRIKNLEGDMNTIQAERVSASRWSAVLAFIAAIFTGAMSFLGVLAGLYMKSKGMM